ncbi:FUSC family protein [Romboutsia sp. Marseille-P6047]|uniref:FUSC family protein n=1 Tax=Romboutsia sp. Marseille-P6047 TaxID=2161817 RepID=UPI000F04EE44|nr:FUSC family protein [Romboutsia sp. Marseille-P6047]
MNKKLIISKSLVFIFVVAFVVGFKSIFGDENTLIGITTITATLMFLSKDLTISPIRNSIRLILLNLFIGICAMIALSNIWLGIVINFIALFTVSYTLCYNLETPMYFPFTLQYLFLLSAPVNIDQIPKRLLALIFGALFIMLAQIIANKNKMSKSGNKILISVCNAITSKIESMKGQSKENTDIDIESNINAFRKMVYDKREVEFYLTEEGRIKLNLSVALESIYTMLKVIDKSDDVLYIINNLEQLILDTKDVLEGKDIKTDLEKDIYEFLSECEKRNISDLLTLQLLDSTILLKDTLQELKNLKKENYNLVKSIGDIKNNGKIKYMSKNHKSLKFCYAMRVAITITFGAFITDLFNLSEGRWIMFTMLSIINPIYEISKGKIKDRILSTIIGSIIVFILFNIFKDTTSRSLILMLTGYISGYLKEYKHSTICVTVSAIGSAAILGDIGSLTLNRLIFVALGALIAIIANKVIFPYKLKDSNDELQAIYKGAVSDMLREIKNVAGGIKQPHGIKNLLIITSLVEEKLKVNNQILGINSYDKLIKEERFLVTNIYELYIWIIREKVNPKYVKYILDEINQLIEYKNEPIENTIEEIKANIREIKDLRTKITLSSIVIILKELRKISDIKIAI